MTIEGAVERGNVGPIRVAIPTTYGDEVKKTTVGIFHVLISMEIFK